MSGDTDQVMKGMSPEKCLQYLELGEYGMSQLRLRRAALLLFGKSPLRWHPRLQIRILKVDGDAIGTGEDYNVVSDQLITGNILTIIDQAWEALRPHLVQTRFDKSARFEQRSIYPELACREALLNAIAHRDYSDEGRGIEVYIFHSHLEVRNPGALLSSIRLEDIISQKGVHQSRNTHIARVLRELGYMRELGEGMRRIYDLMHRNELAPPTIKSYSDSFSIILTHKPLYSEKDILWLSQFDCFDLDREQKAVILLGENERLFSAQQVWEAVGIVDTEHYRRLIDSLMKLNILSSKIDRDKAKRLARQKKVPFREFPRYGIDVPKQTIDHIGSTASSSSSRNKIDIEDIPDDAKRLFMGNLPYTVSDCDLFEVLAQFGEVTQLYIPVGKGYGFVEFALQNSAKNVLEAEEVIVKGRKIYFRPATPKK